MNVNISIHTCSMKHVAWTLNLIIHLSSEIRWNQANSVSHLLLFRFNFRYFSFLVFSNYQCMVLEETVSGSWTTKTHIASTTFVVTPNSSTLRSIPDDFAKLAIFGIGNDVFALRYANKLMPRWYHNIVMDFGYRWILSPRYCLIVHSLYLGIRHSVLLSVKLPWEKWRIGYPWMFIVMVHANRRMTSYMTNLLSFFFRWIVVFPCIFVFIVMHTEVLQFLERMSISVVLGIFMEVFWNVFVDTTYLAQNILTHFARAINTTHHHQQRFLVTRPMPLYIMICIKALVTLNTYLEIFNTLPTYSLMCDSDRL